MKHRYCFGDNRRTKDIRKIKAERSSYAVLRGSLSKSGPLDFATKYSFPLFFVGEEALVGVY